MDAGFAFSRAMYDILRERLFSHVATKWLYFLLLLVAFELVADILSKQFAVVGNLSWRYWLLSASLPRIRRGSSVCAPVQN